MKWFNNPTSMDEVKKQYKALLRVYHPDNGGDLDKMQEINAEYNELCDRFEKGYSSSSQSGYGYGYGSSYGSYGNSGTDEFSNMVRPAIQQEMSQTINIVVQVLRIYPAIQSKYEKLITHVPVDIYNDLPTVLKVGYEEMQRNFSSSQGNYQFIRLMSDLEDVRRSTRQVYETACRQYGHNFEQEMNDLHGAVGNAIQEQILAIKNSGGNAWGGNRGYYGQNYNSSYPRNSANDDCCQCLGLMMCCDCIDCC